jgi:hypothetical protein
VPRGGCGNGPPVGPRRVDDWRAYTSAAGAGARAAFEEGQSGKSGRPPGRRRNKTTIAAAATIAAVVDTFVRAIETSDFERRLQLVEADRFDHPGEAAGMNGASPNGYYYNP